MGQVCITETSWIHEEWSLDEWNDDLSCDGWHEDWRPDVLYICKLIVV